MWAARDWDGTLKFASKKLKRVDTKGEKYWELDSNDINCTEIIQEDTFEDMKLEFFKNLIWESVPWEFEFVMRNK